VQAWQLRSSVRYEPVTKIFWDDDLYRGDAYPGYAWAVYVAEVAVDMNTYMATCTRFDALQEVGKVMHPVLAKGQIEGGVAQGIGYALYEKCVWQDGHMANNQMTNYIMPTSADLPPIHVHFEETPCIHGPGGAKGIGELPMDGPAPAILNAIENATGISFNAIPLLPEDIYERITALNAADTAAAKSSIPKSISTPKSKAPEVTHEHHQHSRQRRIQIHRRPADEASARRPPRGPAPDRHQGRLRRRRVRRLRRAAERRARQLLPRPRAASERRNALHHRRRQRSEGRCIPFSNASWSAAERSAASALPA
jgi:hypothetical protein